MVFLLGFLLGALINHRTSERKAPLTPLPARLSSKGRISTTLLLTTFGLFVFVFIVTHVVDIPWASTSVRNALGGAEIFDKKPSFSTNEVYARLEQFSSEGFAAYKRFTYTIDVLFPATFFVFLFTLAMFVTQQRLLTASVRKVILSLPVVWILMDFIENIIIYHLLSGFPLRDHFLAGILGFVTVTKFGFLLLSILIPSILLAVLRKLPARTC